MYIQTYGHEYNHIIWIDAGNQSAAHAQFKAKLAPELHVTTEFRGKPKPFETMVKEIYMKMCQNEKGKFRSVLIVFDDADSLNDDSESQIKGIKAYLPPLPWQNEFLEFKILVTSRNRNWELLNNTIIMLDPWTESDCVIFCLEQLEITDTAENQKDSARLGHFFSFNPFALQAATAVILKRQKISADKNYGIRDFIENYEKNGSRTVLKTQPIDNSSGIGPQKLTLVDLWNVSFTKILKLKNGNLAIKIICFASYLSPICLTPEILSSLLPKVKQDDLEQAFDLLQNYFVIEQSNNSLAIHPIIRDIIKETLKSEARQRNILFQETFLNHAAVLVELSTGLVNYLETSLKQNKISSKECNNIIDNILAVTSLWTELPLSTKEYEKAIYSIEIICSITKSYALKMDYSMIIDIYGTLMEGAEIRQGPKHTLLITLKKKKGDVLMKQERYADAKDIYVQVYTAQKKLLGRNHPDTLATQTCIAEAIHCLGDYAGALKTFCAVLIKQKQRQDPNGDPVALTLKLKVAALLYEHGEYTDAVKLLERVLKDSEGVYGQGDANLFQLQTQTWIARVLVKQEKYDKALELYTALIDTNEKVRGPHHRDTLLLKSDYATALSYHGDRKTAQNILQRVLEYQKGTLGYSMLELAETENSLAHAGGRLDDTERAIEMYAHVFQVRSAYLGPEHPLALNTKQAWAYVLYSKRKFDDSTKILMDVLSGQRKALGEYHPDTISTLQYLSHSLFEQGNFEMAAAFAAEIFELKRRKKSLLVDYPHLVRNQLLLDLSITKLPKRLQDYSILTKPPPPSALSPHLPAWIFVEARSVPNNPASNCCFRGLDLTKPGGHRFWCLKLKMWAKIIAALQIMMCIALLNLSLLYLFQNPSNSFGYGPTSRRQTSAELDLFYRLFGIDPDPYGPVDGWKVLFLTPHPALSAAVQCIYIVAGFILYAGVHFKKQVYISIWLSVEVFTIGAFGMCLLFFVYLIFAESGGMTFVFVFLLIMTAQRVFFFYIVFYCRLELKEHLIRAGEEFNSIQFDFVNFA